MSHRIIFIDSNVAEYQSLIPQLPEDSEVIILGASKDGVIQILDALQGKTEISAVDIISHGAPGALMLGSVELSNATLATYTEQLTQIGEHLSDTADILLYGCEVAQGRTGQAFIDQLSLLTGANVAASTNLIGAEALGGDWMLEAHTGLIKANAMQLSYSGVLSSGEFKVSTNSLQSTFPEITALSNGGFVVSWGSPEFEDTYARDSGISAQRYDANGVAVGTEFRVNTTAEDSQEASVITGLSDGGFVVSWWSEESFNGTEIYARHYDANGLAVGPEFRVNTNVRADQSSPAITDLSDGGFVVTWSSFVSDGIHDRGYDDIYAQRYDASGVAVGTEFRVNSTVEYQQTGSTITGLSNGGFVVSWYSEYQDGSDHGVHAQRYDANGVAQGAEFRVNTYTDSSQTMPSVTALVDGGFVVTWISSEQDGSGGGIYAQRYDASGATAGTEFRVNTTVEDSQVLPTITGLSDGGFVVGWQLQDLNYVNSNIYAQRYNASGAAVGTEFQINTTAKNTEASHPTISGLSDGGFVVSWLSFSEEDGSVIYAKRYDANGNEVGGVDFSATADRLFNWAESTFADLFPNHAASQEIAGYHARLYENGNALGEQSGNIYFYDSHSIALVGTVDDFLPGAVAAGF